MFIDLFNSAFIKMICHVYNPIMFIAITLLTAVVAYLNLHTRVFISFTPFYIGVVVLAAFILPKIYSYVTVIIVTIAETYAYWYSFLCVPYKLLSAYQLATLNYNIISNLLVYGVATLLTHDLLNLYTIIRTKMNTDMVTGVLNSISFYKEGEDYLVSAYKHNRSMGVIYFKVERFENININYGHKTGDIALKAIAEIAGDFIRDTDIIGRVGGCEFGIILPKCNQDELEALSESISTAVTVKVNGYNPLVTVDVGAILYHGNHDIYFEELVDRAASVVYSATPSTSGRIEYTTF